MHFARWQVTKDPGSVIATPNQTNPTAYARIGKYKHARIVCAHVGDMGKQHFTCLDSGTAVGTAWQQGSAARQRIKLTALRCPVKWTRMHGRTEKGATE